jgi:CRP/FNR family transcriptional regulator
VEQLRLQKQECEMNRAITAEKSHPANEVGISTRTNAQSGKHCPRSIGVSCASCRLSELCLPIALNENEVDRLDKIVRRNRPNKKGSHLYRQGDRFKSVYAVRSGSFKSYTLTSNGRHRVAGFFLPGEIIGMGGIASKTYVSSMIALEHSSICEIPFNQLERLSQQLPSLQQRFFAIMGNEIAKGQDIHTLLSDFTAEQRVASFLLGLSSRFSRTALSVTHFRLPMSRNDIGEFLGLTLETVSRITHALQRKGIICVNYRDIELTDIEALRDVVEPT